MRTIKNYDAVFTQIISETNKYLDNNNIGTMVLGLSGGIDSTLVAVIGYIIARKYNKRLIGVSLPSNTNASDENDIAKGCAVFCDKFIEHSIQSEFETLKTACENISGTNNLANGNIKARIRMLELYHIAGVNKGIVLDTDNLTEHYLGFFTIHGDVADLNPIGDLWKHEIYELCQWLIKYDWLNEEQKNVIRKAIDILPTDGNGVVAGGDMEQIAPGCEYEDVDNVLDAYINGNIKSINEFIRVHSGDFPMVSNENIYLILNRHLNSEYKRHQMPFKIELEIN